MTEEQRAWERRWAVPAAAAAIGSAVLSVGAIVARGAAVGAPDGDAEALETIDREFGGYLASTVLQALAIALLAPALLYLYRAARHRRPEGARGAPVLAVIGPLAAAVYTVVQAFRLRDVAETFVAERAAAAAAREQRAEDLITGTGEPAVEAVVAIALALSFVLVSLAAMRAGVLSRFVGVIGIIVGVLYALAPAGTGGPQIVQLFWLGALAALFLDRYPGGRGPAWEAGEAIPWPTAGARERLEELGIDRSDGRGAEAESADPDVPRQTPKPSSRKRKRKRR